MSVITPNRGDNPCVCGAIHPCCRFLVDGKCAHSTPGDHHHAPNDTAADHRWPPEVLQQMIESDNVTVRDRGVIAKVIYNNRGQPPEDVAKAIIKAQMEAGLVTFIRTDLDWFLYQVKTEAISGHESPRKGASDE